MPLLRYQLIHPTNALRLENEANEIAHAIPAANSTSASTDTRQSHHAAPDLDIGTRVWIPRLAMYGGITSVPDEKGNLEIQAGSIKIKLSLDQIEETSTSPPTENPSPTVLARRHDPKRELFLRGLRIADIAHRLDASLNDAFLAEEESLRIVHGKGTGAIRRATHKLLLDHPLVESFDIAPLARGGEGVTEVMLARWKN